MISIRLNVIGLFCIPNYYLANARPCLIIKYFYSLRAMLLTVRHYQVSRKSPDKLFAIIYKLD